MDNPEPTSSAVNGRPAKRARSETASPAVAAANDIHASPSPELTISAPSEGFVRDQQFWFVDGSLVLNVQGTAFRVYRDLLSKQSPVLHDLLSSLHLSPDGSCDGTPVAVLTDSPHDWRHLLPLLLPTSTIISRTAFKLQDDFTMLSAWLRLSHKYKIANVMTFAIAALKTVYSDDYDSWIDTDRFVCGSWARPGERKVIERGKVATKRSRLLSQAIVAINFARLLNIPSILPAAFYHCACLGGAIVKGYAHDDGTTEYLSDEDVARCINGMQDLALATADYVLPLVKHLPEHHGCQKGGACRPLWKNSVLDQLSSSNCRAVLGNLALRGVLETFPALSALCDICKRGAGGCIEARRKIVWRDLPKTFDIVDSVGSWPKS